MSKTKRTAILFIALLFLVTSVAFSIMVFIDLTKGDTAKEEIETSLLNKSIEETTNQEQPMEDSKMLKGSKLENFEPLAEVNEIKFIDIKEGDGAAIEKGDSITAHYTGAYAVNGEIFESSLDSGSPFTANLITPQESSDGRGLISGWVQGLPGMKVGGTRRLIIPGNLAYGEAPAGYTPGSGNQPLGTLVFDIQIISKN